MKFRKNIILFHRSILIFPAILIILLAVSCSTPLRDVTYLNEIQTGQTYMNGPTPDEYKVRSSDQLFIQVISDDPLNAAFLNLINT